MKQFHQYAIKATDRFDPAQYSSINEEVISINTQTKELPALFKKEIVVSFLKDHSLQNDWIKANPELIALVTSGSLFMGNIESLFDSCRHNLAFRRDLEMYLLKSFATN